jgi:5'-methylthioadenosine phosphorylase
MSDKIKIAFIGGSGFHEIDGLENIFEKNVDTPFGKPSDKITIGVLNGVRCAFLPRHGKNHSINPSEINHKANIYALKLLGVENIIAFTASGSLKENIKPKEFVIPDQFYDKTKCRLSTFFEKGVVAHVSMAKPFCNNLRDLIHKAAGNLAIEHHFGGTYLCIEGPQFSTKAESEIHKQLGFSVVSMTLCPEVKLAREAEICYAAACAVTDFDVWKDGADVSNEMVMTASIHNSTNIKKIIKNIILNISDKESVCHCSSALKDAMMNSRDYIKASPNYKNISLILDKYCSK